MICGHKCVGSGVGERMKYVLDVSELSGSVMVCDPTATIAKPQLPVLMDWKGKQASLIDLVTD